MSLRFKSWRAAPAATTGQVQAQSMATQDKVLAIACVTALFPIAIGVFQGTITPLAGLSEGMIAIGGALKAFISS